MKTLALWGFKQALNKLALISFVLANVSPAFAQSYGTSPTYIPFTSNALNDPSLIMQAQANINIYGQQGNSLGQLVPGSIFETQMSRHPFHYAMSQPTLSYPTILQSAVQMPTPMGPMIPGTLEQAAMLNNGMTLPMNTSFYMPPADFSYQHVRAIGARTDSHDADINRLVDEIIAASDRQDHESHFWNDDEDDEEDSDYTERRSSRSYSAKSYRSDSDFYSRTMRKSQVAAAAQYRAYAAPQAVQAEDVVMSNSPFKILGPTCGCKDKGMSCVYNRANHGRNMFKGTGGHRGKNTHDGIDIIGRSGTPIIAAADGKVVRVMDQGKAGYGRRIDIKHVDNFMTRYAHLSKWIVKPGQTVKKGQIIGYMGSTGRSSATHLHFEACKLKKGEIKCHDGNVVNPINYMSNGGSNQQKQLNLSCSEAAAIGGASAPATTPQGQRAVRSGRAAR